MNLEKGCLRISAYEASLWVQDGKLAEPLGWEPAVDWAAISHVIKGLIAIVQADSNGGSGQPAATGETSRTIKVGEPGSAAVAAVPVGLVVIAGRAKEAAFANMAGHGGFNGYRIRLQSWKEIEEIAARRSVSITEIVCLPPHES